MGTVSYRKKGTIGALLFLTVRRTTPADRDHPIIASIVLSQGMISNLMTIKD